jgi:hypothetical protein
MRREGVPRAAVFWNLPRMVTPVAGKRGQNTGISGWADDDDVRDG